jgi:uncharacterized protein (UPF0147 family)
MTQVNEIIEYLKELQLESDVNKKFKEKANIVVSILTNNADLAIEKSLHEFEELNSVDMPSYHRTQVWDVISMLESINN